MNVNTVQGCNWNGKSVLINELHFLLPSHLTVYTPPMNVGWLRQMDSRVGFLHPCQNCRELDESCWFEVFLECYVH